MATLQGKITDVTHKPPESLSSITVKAPSVRVGGGTDLIVSSPATVDFDRNTGDVTISGLTGGLSWLYLEGEGWSDSIALSAAEGMISLVEAIANASSAPGIIDYLKLLADFKIRFDETAQDAVDAAADGIKWQRGNVSASVSSIDELPNGAHNVESVTVAGNLGMPTTSIGRLEILGDAARKAARWTPTHATSAVDPEPEIWIAQTNGSGVWSSWSKLSTSEELAGKADESYVDNAIAGKADKTYVDEKTWVKSALTSARNLDDYLGAANQGTYPITSSVGGHPLSTPGWLTVNYDSSSARTRQTVTASSPTDGRSVYRTYSGGAWSDWRPATTVGSTLTSTSNADDITYPGSYPVGNSNASGLPENVIGSIEVIPAGTSISQYIQLFVSSEAVPRMWVRRAGGEWSRIGVNPGEDAGEEIAPEPITWGPIAETTRVASEIAGALSHDRMVAFNGAGGPLRQSRDQGRTWEIIHQFSGQSLELVEPLANGEILVATSGTVEGVSSTRRIYVSDGYDPANPTATTWVHKLTGSAQFVKWVDWSVSQHGPIVLLAEYGPKGGMVWGSGTEPIPEGENARYVHLSLDHGQTWTQIFDLNTFMVSRGQDTTLRHIHGIAWDPYWDRIWLSFGDSMGGNGSNGVIYSDNLGSTWEVAYHSAEVDTPEGWQVVGIQPMKDCILFAGDMTPAGVMRLDREGGKHRTTWNFEEAWNYGSSHKILCHAIRHYETGRGEVVLFGFSREGTASPSMIVGTRDGIHWDLIWESADAASPGFRFMAGPTLTGELVVAINRNGSWTELRGQVDAY